jgi:hypothetical protein
MPGDHDFSRGKNVLRRRFCRPSLFPDCPLSLKQWDCPRSSSEHALRLVRKTLLKGSGVFSLHDALRVLWDGCAKARPGSRRVGLLTDMPVQKRVGISRHGLLTALWPVGSKRRKCHDRPMKCRVAWWQEAPDAARCEKKFYGECKPAKKLL